MSNLRLVFTEYGGDYAVTMDRFLNNETIYLRFLDMLFEDKNLALLGSALEQGDLEGAFAAAHTLKGVAANMGLSPLFAAVCAIVEPLRTQAPRSDYPQLYSNIVDEFARVRTMRSAVVVE